MIPILYDKSETTFTSQGLGALSDAISCSVTEERNGSYELEMTYPVGGIHYADIQYGRLVLAVPSADADAEPFEIYKITRPLSGKVKIYAQHVSYRLSYTATLPSGRLYESASAALQSLKDYAASDCPFVFESNVGTAGQWQNHKVQSIRSLLGGQDGSVLDIFGGEYQWDRYTVRLLASRGSAQPITIEYGKNLTDLQQEENIASTYTAVICMWTQSTDESGTTTVYGDLVKTANADSYPYLRTKIVDVSSEYDSAPTKDQLTARAKTYINANDLGVPSVNIKVSFVNLRDTEEYKGIAPLQTVHLCDTIKVRFAALGVDATAKVITTEWDVLNERYDSIEVGDSKSTLAQTILAGDEEALRRTDVRFEIAEQGIYAEVKRAQTAEGDLSSRLSVTADAITSEVSRAQGVEGSLSSRIEQNATAITSKVTSGQVESIIEQKADSIRLKADKIEWSATNSSMSEDGTLTCKNANVSGAVTATAGKIAGYTISGASLQCNRSSVREWGGDGVYIGSDGFAVGQASGWQGQPVFFVRTGSDFSNVGCTGIGIYGQNNVSTSDSGCFISADSGGDGAGNKGIRLNGSIECGTEGTPYGVYGVIHDRSDWRLKRDIQEIALDESRELILGIVPSTYVYKGDDKDTVHRGFIAQQLAEHIAEGRGIVSTKKSENGTEYMYLTYTELIADLVNVIQDQERRIAALEEGKNGNN